MKHIAVMAWEADGTVSKYLDFDAETDAQEHIYSASDRYPNAFVAPDPGGNFAQWRAVNGSLNVVPPAPPQPKRPALPDNVATPVLLARLRDLGLDV